MVKKLFSGLFVSIFTLTAAVPAHAASISEQVNLCAEAINAQELAVVSDYRVKFIRTTGGSAKRLSLELIPHADGEVLRAECKVRRGKVVEVALQS
ncbi:MAG: hypothetical protein GXP06_07090 [Alphaproteobacteria bacterium]|nr:hypothetical protein [Alphaproteobacteria bacterium]